MFTLHPPQSESVTFDEAGRTVPMVELPQLRCGRSGIRGLGDDGEDSRGVRGRSPSLHYRAWVEAGRGEKPVDPFERAVAGLALGGEEFTRRFVYLMRAAVSGEEPSARQLRRHHEKRRSPQQIEQAVEDLFRDEHPRRRARMFLCAQRLYSLMTVREIPERYGKGSSAVSMAVKAIKRESENDLSLAAKLQQLGQRLITKSEK